MQKFWKFTRMAWLNLIENKLKSILTMLGIIIGIASVIAIISIGQSAQNMILFSVKSFGPKSIVIQPGGGNKGGPPSPMAIDKIKYKDYLAVKNLNYLKDVSAFLIYQAPVTHLSVTQNVMIIGSDKNYPKILNIGMKKGRFIDQSDLSNRREIAVLGYKISDKLFGDQNPIGKAIVIGGKNFTVVGITDKQGTRFFQDFDSRVMIPLTTMHAEIKTVDYVSMIFVRVKGNISVAMDNLRIFMRKRHSINNPTGDVNKDDFKVISQVQAADTFGQISMVLQIFLIMIAAISLLVAGVGIMNIMLVSVTERTYEIGLRKAVGASQSDILLQFLIESILLTVIAGVIGIIVGIGLSGMVYLFVNRIYDEWQLVISIGPILIAFSVSAIVGLLFGLYPAWSASKLNPIEALIQEI